MGQKLMKVRDFALLSGCTPQNVYGHLRTYAEELEGHLVKGKGRQGIYLDEFAQDFVRSVMYPKDLAPAAAAEEIEALRQQLLQLGLANTELASKLARTEGERDKAMLEAGESQRLLLVSREAEEAKAQELAAAQEQAGQLAEDLQAAQDKIQRLMSRGLWARLTNKEVE